MDGNWKSGPQPGPASLAAPPLPSETGRWAPALLLYDAECDICSGLAGRLSSTLGRRGFRLVPLQKATQIPGIASRGAASGKENFDSMAVVPAAGPALETARALLFVSRRIWWAFPIRIVAKLPFGMPALERIYAWAARNRFCLNNSCSRAATKRRLSWGPLVFLPASSFALRGGMPEWAWMWVLAFALFLGVKWLTLQQARSRTRPTPHRRALAYLFGWVGMDAAQFLRQPATVASAPKREWLTGLRNTLLGIGLLWVGVGLLPPDWSLVRAWTGLLGLILILHFGLFHLLAAFWRHQGFDARPIMRRPLLSTSLSEFWGKRWNVGFRELSHRFVFGPLRRRVGVAGATFAAFLFSGLIHDLVISVPAGGGYGLPSAYFALQGLGVLLERSQAGRRMRLGCGWTGRLFTVAVAALPVGLLFHKRFIDRIALPMLDAFAAFSIS